MFAMIIIVLLVMVAIYFIIIKPQMNSPTVTKVRGMIRRDKTDKDKNTL